VDPDYTYDQPIDVCCHVVGKHGREEELVGAAKKVHVDTNAVTRKGVEDDFESLLRFYYGAKIRIPILAPKLSICDCCPRSQGLPLRKDVEMDELWQR